VDPGAQDATTFEAKPCNSFSTLQQALVCTQRGPVDVIRGFCYKYKELLWSVEDALSEAGFVFSSLWARDARSDTKPYDADFFGMMGTFVDFSHKTTTKWVSCLSKNSPCSSSCTSAAHRFDKHCTFNDSCTSAAHRFDKHCTQSTRIRVDCVPRKNWCWENSAEFYWTKEGLG